MSYLTQMLALTVQNFVSAAAGMAVLVALIRGFARQTATTIGNFWVDLTRGVVYILLPLSLVLALVLVSQGSRPDVLSLPGGHARGADHGAGRTAVTTQRIAVGPAASQVAIKQLGTNGGGFFNVNSAHPLENPTPLSNFLQLLAILLIPAALCLTFGEMVGDRRQGWAMLAAMTVVLRRRARAGRRGGRAGQPRARRDRAWTRRGAGNMEGKEVRFGSPTRRSGRWRRRPRPTARSTRCTTRTRRWAGWRRCG